MKKIYLDNNATTALDPRVLEAMREDLCGIPRNPSSVHAFGRDARNLLIKARRSVADYLGFSAHDLVFTSGGTEAINLAIHGILHRRPGHVITSTVEHPCVLETLAAYSDVTYLDPGTWGAIQPERLKTALRPNTRLIVLMAANNETGVLTDLDGIAALAEQADIPLLIDGTAWLGKASPTLPPGVTAVAFSAHKFHGPKGVGLLALRPNLKLKPQITGGAQQEGRRGGTENLAGLLGFARALELITPADWEEMRILRARLEKGIQALHPDAAINGEGPRICNTTNIAFNGLDGEALLMNLDLAGIAVSHGSACSSGSLEPSHVLLAMGYPRSRVRSSIRFSLSRQTTTREIDYTLAVLGEILDRFSN